MEGVLRGPDRGRGELTEEALASLREAAAADAEPLILGYHPVARMNPFQSLLYGRTRAHGIAALPIVREERIDELAELGRRGVPIALHLHWLNMVLGGVEAPEARRKAIARFLRRIDAFRGAGGRIVWTVHNILPHDATNEPDEAALRAAIVERAEVVHVMAAETADLVRPWFSIPESKIVHVPHPSYLGAYPDVIGRDEARHQLGLDPDSLVYVVLGAIKPYKGLDDLLDAWATLAGDGIDRRLLIAGMPSEDRGIGGVLERCALDPTILLHARRIPSEDVQVFMRAADVAVLPYVRTLNSGVLMLAFTYGLPVIVPTGGPLAGLTDARFARTFEAGDVASLAGALERAADLCSDEARAAARAVAEANAPGPIADRFASVLRAAIGSSATARDPAAVHVAAR